MNRKISLISLCCIVFIALLLRTIRIGSIPPSINWDEAAWGYNAYSLGTDARDEFGVLLPYKYLESFGDFKPPVYAYLDILPIKILGLNEFATRLPSALFGTLTVIFTYFLVRRLFYESRYREWYSLLSAACLAISPWHINLSRAAFEANVASCFIVAGVWLFLESVAKRPYLLILSAISFVLSVYTFNTARIVSPLLILVLAIIYWRTLLKNYQATIIAGIIGLIILLPTVPFLLSKQAGLRFQEVNIFTDISVVQRSNQEIQNDHNAVWSKLIHNRRLEYGAEFLVHYFDNLGPQFLFISGDGNPKFSTQDVGELYLWMMPFLVFGLLFLFRKREGVWWLIPVWLLLGIIPAATARETPHALRTETILPTVQILIAYGIVQAYLLMKRSKMSEMYQKLCISVGVCVVLISSIIYLNSYYTVYPKTYSGEWQYGYKDVVSYVVSVQNSYEHIAMTEALGRPYIYFLYYLQYDPKIFRATAKIDRDAFGFVHVRAFDKYVFSDANPVKDGSRTLYIMTPDKLPTGAQIQHSFYLLNGQKELVAYTI